MPEELDPRRLDGRGVAGRRQRGGRLAGQIVQFGEKIRQCHAEA